jgi:hypothetical protein
MIEKILFLILLNTIKKSFGHKNIEKFLLKNFFTRKPIEFKVSRHRDTMDNFIVYQSKGTGYI